MTDSAGADSGADDNAGRRFCLVVVINFQNINMTWYEMPEMLLNRFSLKLPNAASTLATNAFT